jgi:putative ABC transport system permease protein
MARNNSVTGFSIALERGPGYQQRLEEVSRAVEQMPDGRGRRISLSVLPTAEYVNRASHIRIAHAMAWLTSVIAVIIGAIGMLNTMIMSVFERTREIGILRAIGWRRGRIVRMVIGEALLLSIVGALLGGLGAMLLTRGLSALPAASGFIAGDISLHVLSYGFVLALLVGLLGGMYPALRAAFLLPTEALRHE